jgi:undecaprenyl-phosphate 4-deoxy-4-formamido-L-arabinose transferase
MKISVIVPVYNSSQILSELNRRVFNSIDKMGLSKKFEFLLINDCSSDNSWELIKNLSRKYSYIKGLNLSQNFGQHNAIMAGLNNCTGEKIITLDDDLQHPPEFFSNILEKLKNNDVCYTYYKNRQHIKWKKIVSQINNIVSSFLLNKPFNIYMSSFRGLNKNIVLKIIDNKEPNVYIDSLILSSSKKVGMITVEHDARHKGESNYTFKKLLILWSNMVINFSFYPIRIASIFGIILKILIKFFRNKDNKNQFKIIEKTF